MIQTFKKLTFLGICSQLHSAEDIHISGEMQQWHKITLTINGPSAEETDIKPNPFTDIEFNVRFTHESGTPDYLIPGYYTADGNAAETSATEGNKWRAHLSPDKIGQWTYTIDFKNSQSHRKTGNFHIKATTKSGRDLRKKGRLQYVGKRYLRHAGNGEYFLKAGADSPETFLAYKDFDGTVANNPKKGPLKAWQAHVKDWNSGDPTWQNGKGKGMIGAINYLANTGANAFSFIPYNAGGDGDNVWPHISRKDKLHFDCSKLDQWGIIFDHATSKGMFLHFKLQETENDDLKGKKSAGTAQALDKGELGPERKAYLREMVARFGHNLALNWNIGEENTQSIQQVIAQAQYIRSIDPYDHLIVLHTYPNQRDKIYGNLSGNKDALTGISMQNSDIRNTHKHTLQWVTESAKSGHPWVVAFDESGNASFGTPANDDWPGMREAIKKNQQSKKPQHIPSNDDVRAQVLWGNLMAGGCGVEYYFGYKLPENDLLAENWRSRGQTWKHSGIALKFFRESGVPFWEMNNTNALVGNTKNSNTAYCLAKPGEAYLIYTRKADEAQLDLTRDKKHYDIKWFNPREGGALLMGSIKTIQGGSKVNIGTPPTDADKDWVILLTTH